MLMLPASAVVSGPLMPVPLTLSAATAPSVEVCSGLTKRKDF